MKKSFLTLAFGLMIALQTYAQKPVYTFTFKVYVNEATATYYGGRTATENLIKAQFEQVNQIYNQESRFTGSYKFVPSTFSYFTETGANQNKLNSIASSSPESSHNYRILYSHRPYGGHPNILADYEVTTRSIRFALNAEAEWGQTLFGQIPTRILGHELGHARGASDLYAANVVAGNNALNGMEYTYPVASIMNYLYNLSAGWDGHSIASINASGSSILTSASWKTLFWSFFPSKMTVVVKNSQGVALPNTKVTIYGVNWLSSSLNSSDATVYTTDSQGKISFDLSNTANNPFKTNDVFPKYSNLAVVVGTQTASAKWVTVFDVQNAKISGASEYVLNVVGTSSTPVVSITSPSNNSTYSAPAAITINANASVNGGSIAKVEFYNGSTKLGEDASSPYVHTWTSVAAGTYTLTAKAFDNLGASATSSAVTVVVNTSGTATDFCIEAESAIGQSTFAPYQVINNTSASGGKYIVVPNGTGNQSSPPTASIATYGFNVPATATYYFWVRILAPTSNDNAMYIRTDASSFASWTPGTNTSWTWKKWTSKSMSAGPHTISLARNKDGLQIDKIFITKSSSTPSGLGCTGSAREEEMEADVVFEEVSSDSDVQLLIAPNPSNGEFHLLSAVKNIAYMSVRNAYGVEVYAASQVEKGQYLAFGQGFEAGIYNIMVKYQDGSSKSATVVKVK
jgi:hypothetical protein